MGKYFGTDGVRGEANVELTPEMAFKLGRFGGYVLSQHELGTPKVYVGRDTRISGQMLASSLISGLLSVGIEVYDLGVIATPGVAYLVKKDGASAGVMISASHNPALDNGIKFFDGKEIEALGVGSFGPIDPDLTSPTYGYITTTPKPGWNNYNIMGALKERYDIPMAFDTDVNLSLIHI